MIEPASALLLTRLVFNLAALLLWGASAYLLLIPALALRASLGRRLYPWGVGVAGLAALALLVQLPALTAALGSGWLQALDAHMLTLVATRTVVGSAWCWQLAAMAWLLVVLASRALRRAGVISLAAALMLATLTVSGHTAMHDGALGGLHRFNDWLHLLAGGFWLGALIPVVMVLSHLKEADTRAAATQALIRFSSAGHLAVALVVVSGLLNTWLVVGGVPLDDSVAYQRALWLKVALVGLLVVVALFNRYWLVPRLGREPRALVRLRRVSMLEVGMLVVIVALVSWFGTLPPGHG